MKVGPFVGSAAIHHPTQRPHYTSWLRLLSQVWTRTRRVAHRQNSECSEFVGDVFIEVRIMFPTHAALFRIPQDLVS